MKGVISKLSVLFLQLFYKSKIITKQKVLIHAVLLFLGRHPSVCLLSSVEGLKCVPMVSLHRKLFFRLKKKFHLVKQLSRQKGQEPASHRRPKMLPARGSSTSHLWIF